MTVFANHWQDAVVASSGTVSAAVNLGKDYEYINVIVPTCDSTTLALQVSKDGTTYYTLGISAATAATTGNLATTLEVGGYQWIKIVCGSTQAAERTCPVRGYRG